MTFGTDLRYSLHALVRKGIFFFFYQVVVSMGCYAVILWLSFVLDVTDSVTLEDRDLHLSLSVHPVLTDLPFYFNKIVQQNKTLSYITGKNIQLKFYSKFN